MIQSNNFESFDMNINKIVEKSSSFAINRLIEALGIVIIFLSFAILASLLTYSPDDPNFIIKNDREIENILGSKGSYFSDIMFQSFGLISYLSPITIFFIGLTIIRSKKIIFIIENIFYLIIYSLLGASFYSIYYEESFSLMINGNGGFVGNFLKNLFFQNIILLDNIIIYFVHLGLTVFFFLISINFKLIIFKNFFKFINDFKIKKANMSNNNSIEEFNSDLKQNFVDESNRLQDDLPFNKINENEKNKIKFRLPKIEILENNKNDNVNKKNEVIDDTFLEKILLDFGVKGKIKKINYGPVVTLNEFEPAAGVKVSKIINLSEDIARNTSSESARISIIPGSNTVGIELPNEFRENVYLRDIISKSNFYSKDYKLPIALGKSISGVPIVGDLSSMPHLLIAGTTGSGKSVCINTIILSLMFKHTPEKCKFILIDPKMLELSTYEGIPHLISPVITEAKKATAVLGWVVKEMENRYKLMTKEGVRNIDGYNKKHKLQMPYIVVIVDEMSDLMHVAGKEIEGYIQKLSQMARASGIHIIMATQRPSVDVITGTIKANFPTRISFQVSSKIDSRTILGEQGAEQLLGKGDMLYMSSANRIIRIHSPFVSDKEIDKVNNFLRSQSEPDYIDEILNFADEKDIDENTEIINNKDALYDTALEIVRSEGKASTSYLQRKLQIGYNRAARIIDMMEEKGIVSKANHVGKRDVIK